MPIPRAPVPWHRKFQSLMPFRVREILLVSSGYDAFVLEEDGSLSDRLFVEYSELNLSWAPRFTHVEDAHEALALCDERRFDLLITVVRIGETDAAELSRAVKSRHPAMPIVLLLFDEADLSQFPGGRAPADVDRVFFWTGDASLLIAVIKTIEDDKNLAHDTTTAGVQVILVVEDRVRAYSSFLALLYPALLNQAGSLIAEGLNDFHRLMRMRARPKIALATSAEQARALFEAHREYVWALMTDLRVPRREGEAPDEACGTELARFIRAENPDLPILIQSDEPHAATLAQQLGAAWSVRKFAPNFQQRVRSFLAEALGFGDFVFRLPDRAEVARARDLYEMELALRHVPAESIEYHASHNHFSLWLMARSMFELARHLRPQRIHDFNGIEAVREHLIDVLHQARRHEQLGVVTDFSSRLTGPENRFVRVGRGSMGGKGRGIAFVSTQIVRHGLLERFEGLEVRIPKTVVLGTEAYERFVEPIDLAELCALDDDARVTARVLERSLPQETLRDLRVAFDALKGPLAVRSSSLLEDSRFRPFAGVYATYMLPNGDDDRDRAFATMCRSIKAVYASAFWRSARTYLRGTPHELEDQKMAVVIQQVVGQRYGTRFYPLLSGVAQSCNYYPVGGQRAEDGVALVALGLGHTVVGGGTALRFSPGSPTVLPQFPSARDFLKASQSEYLAVDLSRAANLLEGPEGSLCRCDLAQAEADGVLAMAGSVYCAEDDVVRENLALAGPRVITFHNLLKWNAVPLAAALREILPLLRDGMGEEVEIEVALDMAGLDEEPLTGRTRRVPRLFVLQLRPMPAIETRALALDPAELEGPALLCRSEAALGHGSYEAIRDIVLVRRDTLDLAIGREVAAAVGALNAELDAAGRPYLLVGPGRWGSTDPTLGIPVAWYDIAGARVIAETPIGTQRVEPSQGTHFFRNMTALKIAYLAVDPVAGGWIDRAWLEGVPAASERGAVRHLRLDEPLGVYLDGRRGRAWILKRPL